MVVPLVNFIAFISAHVYARYGRIQLFRLRRLCLCLSHMHLFYNRALEAPPYHFRTILCAAVFFPIFFFPAFFFAPSSFVAGPYAAFFSAACLLPFSDPGGDFRPKNTARLTHAMPTAPIPYAAPLPAHQ